jgi:hypothetical protein
VNPPFVVLLWLLCTNACCVLGTCLDLVGESRRVSERLVALEKAS